ncbi:hypothetical protein EUTSA_v10022212mg [Eutrema salsugineum]|uniref:Gnk2-homologous domain-containing protein n=1 Tax=Eutrema salsugineum TaxID=72664 RepID=V4LB70_EUTSA|nr:hypothetical protein EUTSA_v10022212mg [Eutrema salsugineum]
MFSSHFLSKRLISGNILAVQLLLILGSVSSMNLTNEYLHHNCLVTQGNYKPGSKYAKDLNYLIESVSLLELKNGFVSMTYGEAPDSVTIVFQCRGDSYGPKCRSCYAIAVAGNLLECLTSSLSQHSPP